MAASNFYPIGTPENIAFEQGYKAYRDRKGLETNPYKKKTLRDAWEAGWRYAEENPQP